jgi:ketosteroid isomerase-like protein
MEEIRYLPERFWEVGDQVVVDVLLTARGKSTGIPVEQRTGQIWSVLDGKVRSARLYQDPAHALAAVGLRE